MPLPNLSATRCFSVSTVQLASTPSVLVYSAPGASRRYHSFRLAMSRVESLLQCRLHVIIPHNRCVINRRDHLCAQPRHIAAVSNPEHQPLASEPSGWAETPLRGRRSKPRGGAPRRLAAQPLQIPGLRLEGIAEGIGCSRGGGARFQGRFCLGTAQTSHDRRGGSAWAAHVLFLASLAQSTINRNSRRHRRNSRRCRH